MFLAMTLLVRDEMDIVKDMLEFHFAHGVDHILITDNGSTDGTYELCQEYERQGRVELMTEPPSDFSQHRWVTRMANIAYEKYHADRVIHADADELFVPAHPSVSIKESLEQVPDDVSVIQVARHDFVPYQRPDEKRPFVEMIYRKNGSLNLNGILLPPKVVHRGAENVVISQGNHHVTGAGIASPVPTQELAIYHYPIRTLGQFVSKVRNGGSGYAQNKELPSTVGFHKRYWYELLLAGRLREIYCTRYLRTPSLLETAIRMGKIIADRRVADFFGREMVVD